MAGCPCRRDTCAIIAFAIIGGIALIALLGHRATVVPMYEFGEAFEMATCRVASVNYTAGDLSCKYCYSTTTYTCTRENSRSRNCRHRSKTKCKLTVFPCVKVNITYVINGGDQQGALLHFDQAHLAAEPRCSYQICNRDVSYSRRVVANYAAKYESMSSQEEFTCYVNKDRKTDAIEAKKYNQSDVVHGTIWPIVIIVVCALICIGLLIWRCRENKRQREAAVVKTGAEAVPLNVANPQQTTNQQPVVMPPPQTMSEPPPAYSPAPQPGGPMPLHPHQGYAGYPPQVAMGQQYYPPGPQVPQGGVPYGQGYPPPNAGYYPPPQPTGYPQPQAGYYPPPEKTGIPEKVPQPQY